MYNSFEFVCVLFSLAFSYFNCHFCFVSLYQGYLWDDNQAVTKWFLEQEELETKTGKSFLTENITALKKNHIKQQISE